jgi:hypothetical protein
VCRIKAKWGMVSNAYFINCKLPLLITSDFHPP